MPTNLSLIPRPQIRTPKQRGIHHAPTPWITAMQPTSTISLAYKFRLVRRRRGGAIHVEMHKQSAHAPGKTYVVRSTKQGFSTFVQAALLLLRCSMWDPTAALGHPRAIWNRNAPDIDQRLENAQTVVAFLPRLIDPKPGRPRNTTTDPNYIAALPNDPQVRVGYTAARRARVNEMLMMTQRVSNAMQPMLERIASGSKHLVGFTREEAMAISAQLHQIDHQNNRLRLMLTTGPIVATETQQQPDTPQPGAAPDEQTLPTFELAE